MPQGRGPQIHTCLSSRHPVPLCINHLQGSRKYNRQLLNVSTRCKALHNHTNVGRSIRLLASSSHQQQAILQSPVWSPNSEPTGSPDRVRRVPMLRSWTVTSLHAPLEASGSVA
ncbi:hypothetical protein VTI28DRAFT_5733 [Corynascus sepedonium]